MVKKILILLIILLNITIPVLAQEGWPTNNIEQNEVITSFDSVEDEYIQFTEDSVKELDENITSFEKMDRSTKSFSTYTSNEDILPEVSIDDAIEWANKKGFEIIHFLQVLVQPFAIIIFIISALFTLVGSIGRGDMTGKGLWGMVISVIVYAMVLYAPVILKAFVSFIAS